MTYLNFLILFIGIPLLPLIGFYIKTDYLEKKFLIKGIGVLCCLAFVYTTPWDNYILSQGVWWYGPDRILFTIGYVPIEEYSFFLIQTVFTGLWSIFILSKTKKLFFYTQSPIQTQVTTKNLYLVQNHQIKFFKTLVVLFLVLTTLLGFYFLSLQQTFYLGLILAWATPVSLLQFTIGGQHLLANYKTYMLCLVPTTLYLWLIDAYAISDQIWMISETYTIGFKIGVLPIEEMIFFFMTNVLVVQGLILFLIMKNDDRFGKYL